MFAFRVVKLAKMHVLLCAAIKHVRPENCGSIRKDFVMRNGFCAEAHLEAHYQISDPWLRALNFACACFGLKVGD